MLISTILDQASETSKKEGSLLSQEKRASVGMVIWAREVYRSHSTTSKLISIGNLQLVFSSIILILLVFVTVT